MTQDTRKRWRRGIAVLAILIAMLGLTALLRVVTQPRLGVEIGAAVLHSTGPLGPPAPDASLIVTEHEAEGGKVTRCRVVRYDFKNGRLQPSETLWEGSSNRFGHPSTRPIIDNRYLCSWNGSVIDLQEKTLIHEGAGRLIEVRGDRVVSGFFNDRGKLERLVAFNLRTRATEKLTDREVEAITFRATEPWSPDELSPDGTKVVRGYENRITLYRVGQPPKDWGRFQIGESPLWLGVWLDDDRFLTQDGNGNLLTVDLDGARVPVMRIPVKEKKDNWRLHRDSDGRIIYSCWPEHFFINTEAKTWEPCEWVSLGHGFEESSRGDDQFRRVYRYKGTEIARSPFWTLSGPAEVTTEGFIAVWVEGRLQVWSAGTGNWTKLSARTNQIAGWVK
jgi:hypothetical protein